MRVVAYGLRSIIAGKQPSGHVALALCFRFHPIPLYAAQHRPPENQMVPSSSRSVLSRPPWFFLRDNDLPPTWCLTETICGNCRLRQIFRLNMNPQHPTNTHLASRRRPPPVFGHLNILEDGWGATESTRRHLRQQQNAPKIDSTTAPASAGGGGCVCTKPTRLPSYPTVRLLPGGLRGAFWAGTRVITERGGKPPSGLTQDRLPFLARVWGIERDVPSHHHQRNSTQDTPGYPQRQQALSKVLRWCPIVPC